MDTAIKLLNAMKLTPDLVRVLFKHLRPVIEARWVREQPLVEAGFEASVLVRHFDESFVNPNELELQRKIETHELLHQVSGPLLRYQSPWLDEYRQELVRQGADPELIRILSPMAYNMGKARQEPPYPYQDLWQPVRIQCVERQAQEVARFSTELSRGPDEDVYSKLLGPNVYKELFDHEDTLAARVHIIKTLLDEELPPLGFEHDRKLSSVKAIVYSKPFYKDFKLFIATDRTSLNPERIEYQWSLNFTFGLHSLSSKWPGPIYKDNDERWSFLIWWFFPLGSWFIYSEFRFLPQLELSVRFELFAYKLIADEFEAALKAGFAEAEAAGLLTEAAKDATP